MIALHLSFSAARWLWFATWITLALSVLIPTLIPTRLVYHPISVQIDGTIVRVYSVYPMDGISAQRPIVTYLETVTAQDGRVCEDRGEVAPSAGQEFSEWDISDWAAPCMGSAFVWRSDWTAYAFGVIPLRPAFLQLAVF